MRRHSCSQTAHRELRWDATESSQRQPSVSRFETLSPILGNWSFGQFWVKFWRRCSPRLFLLSGFLWEPNERMSACWKCEFHACRSVSCRVNPRKIFTFSRKSGLGAAARAKLVAALWGVPMHAQTFPSGFSTLRGGGLGAQMCSESTKCTCMLARFHSSASSYENRCFS